MPLEFLRSPKRAFQKSLRVNEKATIKARSLCLLHMHSLATKYQAKHRRVLTRGHGRGADVKSSSLFTEVRDSLKQLFKLIASFPPKKGNSANG